MMADPTEFDRRTVHFGTVTAALSHELGNVLATLQEAAGLVDDYVVGAADGEVIEVAHLEPVLGRIDRSIERGLKFVRQMNWIAHSLDTSHHHPDLVEVIEKAAASARYFARQRCVELRVVPAACTARVRISAIDLHILLFSCLRFASDNAAEGAIVTVEVATAELGRVVAFRVTEARPDRQPGEELRDMAESFGARMEWVSTAPPGCRFEIYLPVANEPRSSDRLESNIDQ